jgi:Cu-Zn family superoxide dismutase
MHASKIVLATVAGAACALALTLTTASLYAQGVAKKALAPPAQGGGMMMQAGPAITKAVAVLHPTKSGGEASGIVTFTKVDGGVKVLAEIRGLTPGKHGFHIHEFGDTSSPDAMSAGSHFDPTMTKHHGSPTEMPRHVGDLGNLEASARGVARVELVLPNLTFSGPTSIIGRGVIVHEKEDNFGQPVGNAGGRVAAGVIGVAKPD